MASVAERDAEVGGDRDGGHDGDHVHDRVWVVVAVYNEARVVRDVVRDLRRTFPHVVAVDDGSTDGSGECARAAGAVVLRHAVNLGQGAALATGLAYVLERTDAEQVVTFDADGQHDPADAARMVSVLRSGCADVALGSRFLDGRTRLGLARRAVLRVAVTTSPSARRLRLTDAHNGLRAFTRDAAAKVEITQDRMAHASEIVTCVGRRGLRVAEVPTHVRYTDYSRSKGQSLLNSVNIVFDLVVR